MTLAFTFKIKDAWVIVADKKTVSQSLSEDSNSIGEAKFFSDNTEKIKELSYGLFFVGSGQEEVLEKMIEIINNSRNFNEFKENIQSKINELYSIWGSEADRKIKDEEFLIIEKGTQDAFKFEIKEIKKGIKKGDHKLNSYLKNNFIGCYESVNLGNVKIKIPSLRNVSFEDVDDKFNDKCNDFLSLISIDNLPSVGHPAIHGSDIWIISKDNVKKIITYPKNDYDYGEA